MGKIKSKMVRRAAEEMKARGVVFGKNFEENKKMLGSNTMPSKKIRNRLAGFLARLEKQKQ